MNPPTAVLQKAREINSSFDSKISDLQRVVGEKCDKLREAMRAEEEAFLARKREIEAKLAAAEEELTREKREVDGRRKEALRALQSEADAARSVLQTWMADLDHYFVGFDGGDTTKKKLSPHKTTMNQSSSSKSHGDDDDDEVGNDGVAAEDDDDAEKTEKEEEEDDDEEENAVKSSRRSSPRKVVAKSASISSSSSSTPAHSTSSAVAKPAKRHIKQDDDDDHEEKTNEEQTKPSPKKKVKQSHQVASSSTTPATSTHTKKLDTLFDNMMAQREGKFGLLAELYERHKNAKILPLKSFPSNEVLRAIECRTCHAPISKEYYSARIGSTENRCKAHKFCGKCAEYITVRFEDRCPGRMWFNCAA